MEDLAKNLEGVFYIATTDGDQPHVRPFDGAAVVDGKLYIGTNSNKKVYAQILKNPKIEIYAEEVRFTAEAYPVEDAGRNEEIIAAIGKNFTDTSAALELRNIQLI